MGDVSLTEPLGNLATSQRCSLTLAQGALSVLTLYFSRIRGIKMNTKETELKQGAATTADLSPQQQPQMEFVE
jgi:hypothetical protein